MKKTAKTFKALADETRLRILALLAQGEMCVCDLMAVLALPQSTVSRHLAYLRNAGWVEDRRQGIWIYYRLDVGGESFARDLLNLLQIHLSSLPLAVRDRETLANFRAAKQLDACS